MRIKRLLALILVLVVVGNLFACVPQTVVFSVKYDATIGGRILGEAEQSVASGSDAMTVEAVANTGYRFIKWSDNNSDKAQRTDLNVLADISATAIFEEIANSYSYIYNNATDFYASQNNTVNSIELKYFSVGKAKLVVPIREHFTFNGWYLDEDFTTQVSDAQGNVLVNHSILENTSRELYAKWTVNEVVTYKILMVFVTELYADLDTGRGYSILVDYKMSDLERQICEMIPVQMSKYLNETFDGLVTFEVDSYFTTVPIGRTELIRTFDKNRYCLYGLAAYRIPEVLDLLDGYGSVITTFCMNDYAFLLHDEGGSANAKHATVHFEGLLNNLLRNDIPVENVLDVDFILWETKYWENGILEHYFHEFIHTVEMQVNSYDYHELSAYYGRNDIRGLVVDRLYLLNQAIINGQRVGIPYEFWRGH